jgi:CheY-like chemotaxis protein
VQVLANLLNNAAKYSPEGAHRGRGARSTARRLVLAGARRGHRHGRELTGRVFDLFSPGPALSDRSQGGLGLGLALVKNLVELHGGTVCLRQPRPGAGQQLHGELPLAGCPPRRPARRTAAALRRRRRPLRLLVVDDNVDAAPRWACCWKPAATRSRSRTIAARAELALHHPPDAGLLDIGLPEMDGNELARRLRADAAYGACVLIAVTGYGQEQDRRMRWRRGSITTWSSRWISRLAGVEAARG